jgi:hypothetical protein
MRICYILLKEIRFETNICMTCYIDIEIQKDQIGIGFWSRGQLLTREARIWHVVTWSPQRCTCIKSHIFPTQYIPNLNCRKFENNRIIETGVPGENQRLSRYRAADFQNKYHWERSQNQTHDLRGERCLLWQS